MAGTSAPSRGFLAGCLLVALGLALACAWIASREWFSRDDFVFLARLREPGAWSWREVFLPPAAREWPFYRPLGMDAYFFLAHRAFGLFAPAWFGVSLGVHFASGALVWRIARQLGFGAQVATATALLSVSRAPSLDEIWYGSVFHYVISDFLGLAALSGFLVHLARGGGAGLIVACGALALALLCNEVNALLPAVLVVAALALPQRPRAARVLRAAAAPAAIAAVYLVFRFGVLAEAPLRPVHTPALGWHVAGNAGRALASLCGGGAGLALALAGALALAAACAREARTELARRAGMALAWLLVALAPFALLPFPQLRYAMLAEAPACLLFGALLDGLRRRVGTRHPRLFEALLLLLVVAALPLPVLARRASEPRGAQPLRLLRAVEALAPAPGTRLVVLYGTPGLAAAADAIPFRYLAYNGKVVEAVFPEAELSLRFHDLAERPPRSVIRPGVRYLALSPELAVAPADPALLARALPRGVEALRP
jgi:hypothetical protein